jgi:hypothetical protein
LGTQTIFHKCPKYFTKVSGFFIKKSNALKFKEKFLNPSPFFGQLVALVRQANIESVIRKAKADKYVKKFKTKDQLFIMLVAVICQIKSLRDLCALFYVNIQKLNQLGLTVRANKALG